MPIYNTNPQNVWGTYITENHRETYTIVADNADDFAAKMANDLSTEHGWSNVRVSSSIPIVLNHSLYYTFTITAERNVQQ